METLLGIKDVDIIESFLDNAIDASEQFTASSDDFFVAAALTQFDSNPEIVESEEYGELLIEHYGWGNSALGYEYGSTHLPNHYCSDEELGFEQGPNTTIFPIFERSIPEV